MRIAVRCRLTDDEQLAGDAERRLRFALNRFDRRIGRVEVRLADLNGPRGGVDQACRLLVRLARPSRVIVVEDTGADPRAAIGRAAERAAHAVARAVAHAHPGRSHSARRGQEDVS